jgi:hypothetical protein
MAIYDFFVSRNGAVANSASYIGHVGRLFYDDTNGVVKLSDGVTEGGTAIPYTVATPTTVGGIKAGAGANVSLDGTLTIDTTGLPLSIGNLSIADTTISTAVADEELIIATNGDGNIEVVGSFHVHPTSGNIAQAIAEEPVFRVLADGQVRILVPLADTQEGGMEIIGSLLGTSLRPGIAGTMLHLTGNADLPTRVYHDTLGGYSSYVFRRYNGSVITPTQVLANEAVARINFTAATDAGMGNVSLAQIRISAIEDQTTTAQGSEIQFFVTPEGSPATSRISALDIRAAGVTSAVGFIGNLTGTADTVTNGVYTTDTGTVTNTMLAGSIANDKLANSTISGVSLGSTLAALSPGNYLTGGDYDGSGIVTHSVDATTTATASKVVARDSSGNFAANTITAINTVLATREAGSFGSGQTITVNFATDRYVHCTVTDEVVTVAYTNITPGKEITIYFTLAGADREVNFGVPATNTSNGNAQENIKGGGTSQITATSFGTTVNDIYVHFKK